MKIALVKDIPKAKLVENFDIANLNKLWVLARELSRTCIERDGVGLHAVQVGVDVDMFVVKVPTLPIDCYFNCSYEPLGDVVKSVEGCLSLDAPMLSLEMAGPVSRRRFFEVPRYNKVRVTGKKLVLEKGVVTAKDVDETWIELLATVFQHEIDHGKGVLISDIGKEIHIW